MLRNLRNLGCASFVLLALVVGGVGLYVASQVLILPDESEVSAELAQMYADDQEVRLDFPDGIRGWATALIGDWIRNQKTRRIVEAELLTTTDDYANAARLLHHGSSVEDAQKALELSRLAYEMGDEEMLRHIALAEDRYLWKTEGQQKYGTQEGCDPERGWHLHPIDPTTTDAERAEFDVAPLAELEAKIEELNQAVGGECAVSSQFISEYVRIMGSE